MDEKNQKETVEGYGIKQSYLFQNNRGFALAENPAAPDPFVTWQFTQDENEARDYYWGHYFTSEYTATKDFANRVTDYMEHFNEAKHKTYRYYSTQRPVDIGTFPKPDGDPLGIVCFNERAPVEDGSFEAWGYIEYAAPLTAKEADDYELRAAPGNPDFAETEQKAFNYYAIDETAARRAKEANSFRDYVPGSATAEYRRMVDAAREIGEQQKKSIDPMHHGKVDYLVDKYARKLAQNFNERNIIDARVPSVMIAGGSNFPVNKKHKQNAARDRNMGEYTEIKGILEKIRGTGTGGISADDNLAVDKLQTKLDMLKISQRTMKEVNAYFRKNKTLDGCPDLSEDTINKLKATMSRDWRKDVPPFPSYQLTNNSAEIRRIEQRIDDLKNKSEYAGWTFAGGKAEINEAENRLQLFFDDKPDDKQRAELKSNGFKWAPSQGAWQRQLTRNAIYSAGRIDCIKPLDGKTPFQHQPFSRKPETDKYDR